MGGGHHICFLLKTPSSFIIYCLLMAMGPILFCVDTSNVLIFTKNHTGWMTIVDTARFDMQETASRHSLSTNPRDIFDRRLFEVVFICELKEVKFSIG